MNQNEMRAVNRILSDQKGLAVIVSDLQPAERRRVLMYVASEYSCYSNVVIEAIKALGFEDVEVLPFLRAAISNGRSRHVASIVKACCTDTSVAKNVLESVFLQLTSDKWHFFCCPPNSQWLLFEAIECLLLMKVEMNPKAEEYSAELQMSRHALKIFKALQTSVDEGYGGLVIEGLRKLTRTEDNWAWLEEHKNDVDAR